MVVSGKAQDFVSGEVMQNASNQQSYSEVRLADVQGTHTKK
jgi:hypothetical protein